MARRIIEIMGGTKTGGEEEQSRDTEGSVQVTVAPFCIFPARHRAHDFDPLVPSVPPPFSPRCPRSSSYIYVRHSSTSTCAASNARLASTAVHFGQRWSLPGVLRFIKHDLVKRKAAEKREQSKNPIWKDIPRGNNKTVRLLQRRYENGSSAEASSGRLARKVILGTNQGGNFNTTRQTFQPFWERNVKIVKRKIERYLHSIGSEARLTSTHPAPPASSDRKRREARLREKEEEQTTRNGRSGKKKRRRRRAGGSVQRR